MFSKILGFLFSNVFYSRTPLANLKEEIVTLASAVRTLDKQVKASKSKDILPKFKGKFFCIFLNVKLVAFSNTLIDLKVLCEYSLMLKVFCNFIVERVLTIQFDQENTTCLCS